MPHIHTKPGQYDFTVSAFIFRLDFKEPKIILHRHRLLGKYLQFGGHVELDETPWQAIIHEIREESGYELAQLKILQPKVRLKHSTGSKLHPYPLSFISHKFNEEHFHSDISFAFVTTEEPKYKLDARESADIKLFSWSELQKLGDETFKNIIDIAGFAFREVLNNWQEVDSKSFIA